MHTSRSDLKNTFRDLKNGDSFLILNDDTIYMKMSDLILLSGVVMNAISVITGIATSFNTDRTVICVNVHYIEKK